MPPVPQENDKNLCFSVSLNRDVQGLLWYLKTPCHHGGSWEGFSHVCSDKLRHIKAPSLAWHIDSSAAKPNIGCM